MPAQSGIAKLPKKEYAARAVYTILGLLLIVAMALDTTIVPIGSSSDNANKGFVAEAFGKKQFPKIRLYVTDKAHSATAIAPEILEDKKQAGAKYGIKAGIGFSIPVKFTGVVGEGKSGIYEIIVEGIPNNIRIRLQTGPAINGTDLRDVTGAIAFGQFKNQIEFQNAGAALNSELKSSVLSLLDTDSLSGKQVSVDGVFKLINPKNWLVTPVAIEVQ